MSSPQEQYAQSLRAGQEAIVEAVQSWTKSAQGAFSNTGASAGSFDSSQVIDQVFDFAEQMLSVQREFAKTLAASAASAGDTARKQAVAAGETVRKRAASAGELARKQPAAAGTARKEAAAAPRKQTRARKS